MDIKTTLAQLYNTLSTIDTHGENTLKMAACLDAVVNMLNSLNSESNDDSTTD